MSVRSLVEATAQLRSAIQGIKGTAGVMVTHFSAADDCGPWVRIDAFLTKPSAGEEDPGEVIIPPFARITMADVWTDADQHRALRLAVDLATAAHEVEEQTGVTVIVNVHGWDVMFLTAR
jgi:hypothetical protein